MKITNLFPSCKFSSLSFWKVASPSPFFNVGYKPQPRELLGGEGVATDEKSVFIQIQKFIILLFRKH